MLVLKNFLSKINMLSVNSMNAQTKLLEMWKDLNVDKCPLNVFKPVKDLETRSSRSKSKNLIPIVCRIVKYKQTFVNDGKKCGILLHHLLNLTNLFPLPNLNQKIC